MIARAHQDAARAAEAYRRGLWVHTTLADSLRAAAETSPRQTVLVDKEIRLDCATLYTQAAELAGALLARVPTGMNAGVGTSAWGVLSEPKRAPPSAARISKLIGEPIRERA